MKNLIIALLGVSSICAFAQSQCYDTENRMGIFRNVSSSGVATRQDPITVCSIINSLESLDSSTVFFSETTTGDAVLEIFYPFQFSSFPNVTGDPYNQNLFPRRVFDDYGDSISGYESNLLKEKLRLPERNTDAAALLTSDRRFYDLLFIATSWTLTASNYHFGVCATGYPKEGAAQTNVSITNLAPTRGGVCYQRTGYYFEK